MRIGRMLHVSRKYVANQYLVWWRRQRSSKVAARIFILCIPASAPHGQLDGEPDGDDDEDDDEARLQEVDPLVPDAVGRGGVHDVEAARLHRRGGGGGV